MQRKPLLCGNSCITAKQKKTISLQVATFDNEINLNLAYE